MEHQPVLGHYFPQHGTTSLDGGVLSGAHTLWEDFNTYPVFWEKNVFTSGKLDWEVEN